jgi:hypothetical protein
VALTLNIYKEMRVAGVRFERAKTGDPDPAYPDVDDRGHNHKVPATDGGPESKEIRGPVIGVTKGKKVKVKLIRSMIDTSAPLYLTSSDTDAVKVIDPDDGKLSSGKEIIVELEGQNFAAAKPKEAKIEVRYASAEGPIVHQLTVFVFSPLPVFIQPHLVTVHNAAGTGGVEPNLNLGTVMSQVSALWAPAGIRFVVQAVKKWSVNLAAANQVAFGEVNTVIARQWQANAINVYIVQQLQNALGYGFSKAAHAGFGISKPSAFAGARQGTDVRGAGDSYWWANDLAHELGHFFTLWHPSDDPGDGSDWELEDTWSMRFLMHNYNATFREPRPRPDWPRYNDFGYGHKSPQNPFRAGLVPMKNVRTSAGAGREAQVSVVRNHILKGPANLY